MKNILKIASITFALTIILGSCTSKKQNCDAYGAISKIENAKKQNEIKKNQPILSEKNS